MNNCGGTLGKSLIGPKLNTPVVDIISDDGLLWIKVSTISEKRLIWDLAKAGWAGSSSDESDDGNEGMEDNLPQGLLQQVETLVKVSRATRVRYVHPKVRLVLSNIKSQPDSKEVARILQQIKDLGVDIQYSEAITLDSTPIAAIISRLADDRFEFFSDNVNLDCTVLVALISDLSHSRVEPQDWHHETISRQIEIEREEQLLPRFLWPAFADKKLFCTREAAAKMMEIVNTIGTEMEKRRASLLLALDGVSQTSQQERLQEFQKLSDYTVPSCWCLPIQVVNVDLDWISSQLPEICRQVLDGLSPMNYSVFSYGWANGMTTISSNRGLARDIETRVEEYRTNDETLGPDIWLTPNSRSLVGKEKQKHPRK